MDNLARNAMLAKQAGMSYGRWKAMQPVMDVKKPETIPEGWKLCEYCKKPYKPFNGMQRFCEYECREKGYYEKSLANSKRYRENRKERNKNECV
jgi:hypothetical protein